MSTLVRDFYSLAVFPAELGATGKSLKESLIKRFTPVRTVGL